MHARIRWILALFLALTGVLACAIVEPPPEDPLDAFDPELAELAQWMSGSFSSAAQSEADSANYFDIRLEVVPIWTDRDDGPWLYVEQAAANALDRPYRQRVYRLKRDLDGKIISATYTLPNDGKSHIGAFKKPRPLSDVTPSRLTLRKGCEIVLERIGPSTFSGSTRGTACESTLQGAKYATSQVIITPVELRSWDRGFGANGQQLWGATAGAYRFDKKES